jgi:hypothetical protein
MLIPSKSNTLTESVHKTFLSVLISILNLLHHICGISTRNGYMLSSCPVAVPTLRGNWQFLFLSTTKLRRAALKQTRPDVCDGRDDYGVLLAPGPRELPLFMFPVVPPRELPLFILPIVPPRVLVLFELPIVPPVLPVVIPILPVVVPVVPVLSEPVVVPVVEPVVPVVLVELVVPVVPVVFVVVFVLLVLSLPPQAVQNRATVAKTKRAKIRRIEFSPCV